MINSTLVAFSESEQTGQKLASFEWEYPRLIHAEVLTHRVFSRNAGSSRAIPTASAIELAQDKMYVPKFRHNQSGMQPGEALAEDLQAQAEEVWKICAGHCITAAEALKELKVHKQWANRMLEWFSPIKIVVTSTEWDNFLWLRNDEEAQDEVEILAKQTEKLLLESEPLLVPHDGLHVPYVERRIVDGKLRYFNNGTEIDPVEALQISASVCAQMSYRKADDSLNKALCLEEIFMNGRRVHASPWEHQGIVTDEGVTHRDTQGRWWSGNFCGWSQYRHLIPNNTCTDLGMARMKEFAGL